MLPKNETFETVSVPQPARGRRPGDPPVPLLPLVGRATEVAEVVALLRRPDVRLVTLIGPGGVGKTHVAVSAIDELGDDLGDVRFVRLSPYHDPALVPAAIAQALELREVQGRSIVEALRARLRGRRILLVLDNFEQVLGAAPFVSELLVQCEDLKVLVTSRGRLNLTGEHAYPIAPLLLPARTSRARWKELRANPAVRLFELRAQAVLPEFVLTEETAPAVLEICRRVDGLPLAILLIASHVRRLSPAEMLDQMQRRLSSLTSPEPSGSTPGRTLRGAIDWSYQLLTPDQQRLFCRLSVFVGGFTLDAAEVVGYSADSPPVLDGVEALLDQSLVRQSVTPEGELRYLILETLREYGMEQLEAHAEIEAALRAHAAYFLALAEHPERIPRVDWLNRLEADRGNLRAALAWLETNDEPELLLRLVAALGNFWDVRGPVGLGVRWLDRALALSSPAPSALRIKALTWAGLLERAQGDMPRAVARGEAALALARALNDPGSLADALHSFGQILVSTGEYARAAALYTESIDLFRGLEGGLWAYPMVNLGIVALQQRDLAKAHEWLEAGLAEHRRWRSTWGAGFALRALADLARAEGKPARARALYAESISIWRGHGYGRGIATALVGLATISGASQQPERTARVLGAAETARQEFGLSLWATELAAYERTLAAVRQLLDPETFEVAWAAGEQITLDEAVAEAITLATETVIAYAEPAPDRSPATPEALTSRERDVLKLLVAGQSNPQIATSLDISRKTAANHVAAILAKLAVPTRAAAAAYAVRHGLVGAAGKRTK